MSKKVLVVDDEQDIQKVVVARIRRFGYDVIAASDGQEALNKMISEKPDLVLLDIMLPGMSGFEVSRMIKSNDLIKNIPVIFLSASVEDLQKKAEDNQADDFLGKPFNPDELRQKIEKFIGPPS